MALYRYVKDTNPRVRQYIQWVSYAALACGMLLLFWAFYPIISFEIYSRFFISRSITSPTPRTMGESTEGFSKNVLGSTTKYSNNLRDFTHASIWFPSAAKVVGTAALPSQEYSISIPKLNISDAKVKIGGEDLSKSLVHYQPVSLPGAIGNTVIFGHSTLPQLYNPKDYKTIFTYLPSLAEGDVIRVTIQNTEYEYRVKNMFVVKPDQVSVLDQVDDRSLLTLVTCVPPGTYWNRLVVRAELQTSADTSL